LLAALRGLTVFIGGGLYSVTGSIVVFGFSILDYLVLLPVAVIEVIEVSSMLW
jgi:hypothetical protein